MMSSCHRALLSSCILALVTSSIAARVLDSADPKVAAMEPEGRAVQTAAPEWKIAPGETLRSEVMLQWSELSPEEAAVQSKVQDHSDAPANFAEQLVALYNNNTVVELKGAGYKNDVAIPLNGTVTIAARDPWSPVLDDSRRFKLVEPLPDDAPTAFSYRGDLMCGIYNVGSCVMTGQLLAVQTMRPAWDSLVLAQCTLNSNAGAACERHFKSGMRIQAEGLAAVTFDDAGAVEKIDALGLAITSIYYYDGSASLIGGLLNLLGTTLGYRGGTLSICAVDPTLQGQYVGNATFNLEKF